MDILQEFKEIVERTKPTVPSTVFKCKILPGGFRCTVMLKRGKTILLKRDLYRSEVEEAIDSDAFASAICSTLCSRFKRLSGYLQTQDRRQRDLF